MKDVLASGTYTGPPKYLKQRQMPLEIPMECIRRLADAIDSNFDERIQMEELSKFVQKHQIPFEEGAVAAMFKEAATGRGFLSEEQINGPITHKEVAAAVRGRHRWNAKTKEWEILYRPYRNYWITLLLTVNKRIFALPMPKIIPSRIKAQYELEEEYLNSLAGKITNSFFPQKNRLYSSLTNIWEPTYKRDLTRNEANIKPELDIESTVRLGPPTNIEKV